MKRWGGCATAEPGANSRCGPTAASIPTPWSPSDECPLLHRHPPQARPPAESHRGDTRRCLDADSLLDGRRRRCGRDHLQPVPGRGGRRAGTAHRPAGEAGARFSTGSLRHLQLSRLHHRPGRGDAGTGGPSSPSRADHIQRRRQRRLADHQDPQTTGLCLGRTDHPLGTPIDLAWEEQFSRALARLRAIPLPA